MIFLQEQLVKQGMKADLATSLIEVASTKCNAVKYDVELAEEYIARQVHTVVFKLHMNWNLLKLLF